MLRQLVLENFKGYSKAEIDFRRISVLVGPNGTGKSSISQALMSLKQSLGRGGLFLDGPLVHLGDFHSVLNRHASKEEIGMRLSVEVTSEYPNWGFPKGASFSYHVYFEPRQLARLDAMIGTPQNEYFRAKWQRTLSGGSVATLVPEEIVVPNLDPEVTIRLNPSTEIAKPISISGVTSHGAVPDEAHLYLDEVRDLFSTIDRQLNNTYLVPAIRGLDRPHYPLSAAPQKDFSPGANAEVASTFAYAGADIAEIVSSWLEAITGSEVDIELIAERNVSMRSNVVRGGIPIIGDGFGTNQLVQLLLTLAIAPRDSLIAIEEPEIHLHPKAQKKLGDIIVMIAKDLEKQIVLTTHSEHVLFSLVSAVRNKVLTQDELAIYYFEERGAEPRHIEQDEYGDIYDWGRNFFEWS